MANEELDFHVPLQELKKRTNEKTKQVHKSWLDNQIKNHSLERLEALQKLKNQQFAKKRENYNKLRRRLKNLTREVKTEFYERKSKKKQTKIKVHFQ